MKTKFYDPYDKNTRKIQTFYCIGDDGASKDPFYEYL